MCEQNTIFSDAIKPTSFEAEINNYRKAKKV